MPFLHHTIKRSVMGTVHKLTITCPLYCEDLIERETEQWGLSVEKVHHGAVTIRGRLEDAYTVCLRSRIANRVLLPLFEFDAADKAELMERIADFPFGDHFTLDDTFAVDSQISHTFFPNPNIANLVVKDAVADSFTRALGRRPNVDLDRPDIRLHLFLDGRKATISLVLLRDRMFRRAFRKHGGAAPLKENVAAAILLRAGWPDVAAGGGALIDLMCGSGTFLYEALLIAGGIAPGVRPNAEGPGAWKGHDQALWRALVEQAAEERRAALSGKLPLIMGYDIEDEALRNAKENLHEADLLRHIHVSRSDFRKVKAPGGGVTTGLVVANPPYGKRLGGGTDLVRLYSDLGLSLSTKFQGYRAAVLAGDKSLARAIGLRAEKLHTIYNGPIRCTIAHFVLSPGNRYRPPEIK